MRLWIPALLLVSHACSAEIPRAYRVVATEYGVPVKVLYAIALAESRTSLGKGVRQPWPWTLNVEGTGYRYGSRRAAYAALDALVRQGTTGVDVGLMQVHWRYHSAKLGNTWSGLQPYHNLRVGARILLDCYDRLGDWTRASGCYHSSTPWRSKAYAATVSNLMADIP